MTTQAHFGPRPVFSSCLHRNVRVLHTFTGCRSFYGEVFDDIREEVQILCLDCNNLFSEEDVRATWNGYSNYAATLEEQDEIR